MITAKIKWVTESGGGKKIVPDNNAKYYPMLKIKVMMRFLIGEIKKFI